MKKQLPLTLTLIIAIILITTGCQVYGQESADPSQDQTAEGQTPSVQEDSTEPDAIAGLTQDEYDGLTFTVKVLERNAILPGMSFTATVLVENTGDKTISYVHGSGSFETPEAVFLYSDSLQPVIPADHLGVMTMDFATYVLEPGDSLLFKLNVMAVEPNPNFDDLTFEMFNEGTYIADMDWDTLHGLDPSLVAVQPGSYTLKAYFLYRIHDENDPFSGFDGPTAFAVAETTITVSN